MFENDTLTGLPMRAALMEFLETECAPDWWVLAFNIDNFAWLNHELGFDTGDAVLREMAGKLKSVCEGARFLSRFGSDTFVAVIEVADETAARTAEDIRQALTQTSVDGWSKPLSVRHACAPTKRAGMRVLEWYKELHDMPV